jgi:hypothetical protein
MRLVFAPNLEFVHQYVTTDIETTEKEIQHEGKNDEFLPIWTEPVDIVSDTLGAVWSGRSWISLQVLWQMNENKN